MAKQYLEQLETAAAAAATEYNEAVSELHALTYQEVEQLDAEAMLTKLQTVAARADAAGAPEEVMMAAQQRANVLHAAVVELFNARATAEAHVVDACRQMSALGLAGTQPVKQALQQAYTLRMDSSEVVKEARTALDDLERRENDRSAELVNAGTSLREAMGDVEQTLERAVREQLVLREFAVADALRAAIKRATAAGVDQTLVYEAGHQLAPIEATERAHINEVRTASEALHSALATDSEVGLKNAMPLASPLQAYIAPELFDTAKTRLAQFESAHELSDSTKALKELIETASGADGAAPLRAALERAEAAGLKGLVVRKATSLLKDLTDLEEGRDRDREAEAWMKTQAIAQEAEAARRKAEEAKREEERGARKEEKRAAKGASGGGGGADYLAAAAAAVSWESHVAPDGRTYYHNNATGVTTWDRPPELDQAGRGASSSMCGGSSGERSASRSVCASTYVGSSSSSSSSTGKARSTSRGKARASSGGSEEAVARAEFLTMKPSKVQKFLRARDVDYEEEATMEALVDLAVSNMRRPLVLWQKTKAADGRYYWFNSKTKATTWQPPQQENL